MTYNKNLDEYRFYINGNLQFSSMDENIYHEQLVHPAVDVFTIDADRFIADTREKWNVIFVDLPDPTSVELAKLYSKEFYLKARRVPLPTLLLSCSRGQSYSVKDGWSRATMTLAR